MMPPSRPSVLSCVALMLAAAVLAALLTKALVQPVLNMTEDLDHIQENVPYRELIPLQRASTSDRILREATRNAAGVYCQCQP